MGILIAFLLALVLIAFLLSLWSFRVLKRRGFRYPIAAGAVVFSIILMCMIAGLFVFLVTGFER